MSTNAIALTEETASAARTDLRAHTDEDLMSAFADGSEDAFQILVNRYASKVVNLISRYTANRDLAEDLAQEVFLRVYRHRRTYRQTGRFYSWLYTIAVNLTRNEVRNKKRRGTSITVDSVTGLNEAGTLQLVDERIGADEEVRRAEIADTVRAAIDTLPPRYREVLILRDLQGLKYEEIADVLGLPGEPCEAASTELASR